MNVSQQMREHLLKTFTPRRPLMLKPGLRVRGNNGVSLVVGLDTASKRSSDNGLPLMTGS